MKAQILTLMALALFFFPAMAWNRAGHMTSGAISYSELQQMAPSKVQKVVALLKSHPEYTSRWKPELEKVSLTDGQKDQYLFMLAARWPDDARGGTFDRPTWHYVNLPFMPGRSGGTPSLDAGTESILTAFPKNVVTLKGSGLSGAEKS